jgi:NAD(P)-dependent dehydrogenase (short-subunit alcohol dehydrogenase family)
MGRVEGKVAVITGAAQGIGQAYAECLAAEGAKVVVTDVQDTSAVVSAITDAGGSAIGLNVDVTSNESLEKMVSDTEAEFGPIDILINNAAVFATIDMKPFTEISEEEWDLVMRVNLRGPFQAVKAVLPSMIKAGSGRIVNIGSGTALRGAPGFLHYVSSKGGIVAQTRSISREVAQHNINANTMIIGLTESDGVLGNEKMLGAAKAPTLGMRTIKRDMVPADVLGTMLFLVTEDSAFITGQSINIDGGALNQ